MPTALGFNLPNARTAERRKQIQSDENAQTATIRAEPPWQGYVPDLDVSVMGLNSCREIEGLVPRADPSGLGEILTHFPGFTHVDSTYADSSATGPKGLGDHGNTQHDIVGLFYFPRYKADGSEDTEFKDTTIAITSGNGSTAGSTQVWRIKPSTGVWEEIVEDTAGSSPALKGAYPVHTATTQLFDFAVFPTSASPRTGLTAMTAGEPCIVFTNNFDNVKLYAIPTGGSSASGKCQDLHRQDFGDFKARSVETWGDRLNFLNTEESGTRHRQRLRRTAIGNADPDTSNTGSGAFDFRDFKGEGLRVESIGSALACYFEDGVAFVRRPVQSSSTYISQIITTERGLLSTHSLCNLGGGFHFGLFTDGWFILSENGQFQEVGLTQATGITSTKWRQNFFERLDINERDRIDCVYDHVMRWVWITLPLDGKSENQDVWVYDLQGDRVFTLEIPVTKFGTSTIQLSDAVTIGGLTGTIGDQVDTIGSFGARFGVENILHGTSNGIVVVHDSEISTRISNTDGSTISPDYKYRTALSGLGDSRHLKALHQFLIEYVNVGGSDFIVRAGSNTGANTETQQLSASLGSTGDIRTISRGFRYSASQINLQLTGTSPVKIRSIEADIYPTRSRVRR